MYYSSAKAERELGYRRTPFSEAVHVTLEWYRKEGYLHCNSPLQPGPTGRISSHRAGTPPDRRVPAGLCQQTATGCTAVTGTAAT